MNPGRTIALAAALFSGCAPGSMKPGDRVRENVVDPRVYGEAARALAAGDAAPCGSSAPCREIFAYMSWLKDVIRKAPGLKARCLSIGYDVIRPAEMGAACDAIIAHSDDPAATAAKLAALADPAKLNGAKLARLPEDVAVSLGLAGESICDDDRRDRELCLAPARYRKARAAGDASLCGASDLCLGMMGVLRAN